MSTYTMKYGILTSSGPDYFAIEPGSRIDHQAERLGTLRRHLNLGTYPLTMFLDDLFADQQEPLVTAHNLSLHLQCVRKAESKGLEGLLSEERILEMVLEMMLERQPSGDDLAKLDPDVLKALDLQIAMAH